MPERKRSLLFWGQVLALMVMLAACLGFELEWLDADRAIGMAVWGGLLLAWLTELYVAHRDRLQRERLAARAALAEIRAEAAEHAWANEATRANAAEHHAEMYRCAYHAELRKREAAPVPRKDLN